MTNPLPDPHHLCGDCRTRLDRITRLRAEADKLERIVAECNAVTGRYDPSPLVPISNDEKLLSALQGATFGPGASLVLPSGRRLTSDEANWDADRFAEDRLRALGTEQGAALADEIARGRTRREQGR